MTIMTYNILRDADFKNGFRLKGLNSLKDGHSAKKTVCGKGEIPDWFLCQWNSRYDMATDGVLEKTAEGYRFYDASKSLETDEKGGVILSLGAEKEYDRPRAVDEPWPHLLLEQNVEPYVRILDLSGLRVKGTFELKEFRDYMAGKGEEHHTAQFVWVMVVKNVNERSPDFGHFLWIVMSLFDSRYEFSPLYCAQDKALPDGEFIYSFCSADYMKGKLLAGEPQTVDFDVYPRLGEMLKRAQAARYLTKTEMSDLALTGMNFGFEITGTYRASVLAEEVGIWVTLRTEKDGINEKEWKGEKI